MTTFSEARRHPAAPAAQSDAQPLLFEAKGLAKSYGRAVVLNDVSFEVPSNRVVTFVGENGAGKSTLFNILSGLVKPDQGAMRLAGRSFGVRSYGEAVAKGVSRVFQEQSLVANIPVYENLLLGHERRFTRAGQLIDKRAMIAAAERIVEEAGIDVDVRRRTGDYDFSKRQSIEIARACLATTHLAGITTPFILLDEPTSALDRRDEEAFFRLVARIKQRGSLLFVSHRLTEVLEISDIIYVLKDGELVARLDPRRTDEQQLHALMVGRERAADYYHERRQRRIEGSDYVIQADRLTDPGQFEDVSLTVRPGEVVGIGGLLDSGKSAMGKAIAGVVPAASGTVSLRGGQGGPAAHQPPRAQGIGLCPRRTAGRGNDCTLQRGLEHLARQRRRPFLQPVRHLAPAQGDRGRAALCPAIVDQVGHAEFEQRQALRWQPAEGRPGPLARPRSRHSRSRQSHPRRRCGRQGRDLSPDPRPDGRWCRHSTDHR